jgi:hypothetical protein
MHLDGGGSSTMVIRNPESGRMSVANTLSDGVERRIVNALGVFDRAPPGQMTGLGLNLSQRHVFVNTPVWSEAFGRDYLMRRVELPADAIVTYYSEPFEGGWNGDRYVPRSTGTQTVQAIYGGLNAWQYLYVHDIAELQSQPASIRTAEGLQTQVRFTGLSMDGTQVPADNGVSVRVVPAELGFFNDGVFTGINAGSGYLECTLNGVTAYVPVVVGGFAQGVNVFNTGLMPALGGPVKFSGSPDAVSGWVIPENVDGRSVTGLYYNFEPGHTTQAANVNFDPPLTLSGNPMAVRMSVMGDGSGHWLRGNVTDGTGRSHNVDFLRNVDFTSWQTVTAMLPDAPGPFRLNRVYMVEMTVMEADTNRLYLDRLEILYAPGIIMGTPTTLYRFNDPKRLPEGIGNPTLTVPSAVTGYSVQKQGNAAVATLRAANGGLFATDKQQWARLVPDVNALMPDFVVAVLDINPLDFTQAKELELFHLALTHLGRQNRPVFVVSATGEETVLTMKDGIRYIDFAAGTAGINLWAVEGDVFWSP